VTTVDPTAGSHLWQTVFVSFAVLVILFEMLRGWRLGLLRQIVRLLAIVAAYATAIFGGRMLLPIIRPMVRLPDIVLSVLGGAILAMLVYAVINGIGGVLFKRTSQQESGAIRLIYGVSGAMLGFLFGGFFVCLILLGVRSIGSVAEAQVHAQNAAPRPENSRRIVNGRLVPARSAESNSVPELLARLKNSVELGRVGEVVKKADPLPAGSFQTLGKVGEALSKPERVERFLSFPGARDLSMHPRIVWLRQDPEIAKMISEGRFFDLLQDRRIIDAVNDPTLVERLKKFDLQRALDYAAHAQPDGPQQ
jgi:hypothetical protein